MNKITRRLLYWTPRILCIAFAMFISMFALDVFSEHLSFWRTLLALSIHLIPTYIMIIFLVLAWKWEWVGGVGFAALGLLYIIMFRGCFPLSIYFVIAGPAFAIALLFIFNWIYRKELRVAA